MGYYNTEHRDRLRLIAHLQERGFSLAAIKETLDHWTEGRSLAPPPRRQPDSSQPRTQAPSSSEGSSSTSAGMHWSRVSLNTPKRGLGTKGAVPAHP